MAPPAAATAPLVTPQSKALIITWTASVTASVTYTVLRSSCGAAGPFLLVSSVLTDVSFADTTVLPGAYYYKIRTSNADGEYTDTLAFVGQFSGPRPLNDDGDASGTTETRAAFVVYVGGRTQGMSEAERILKLKGRALMC